VPRARGLPYSFQLPEFREEARDLEGLEELRGEAAKLVSEAVEDVMKSRSCLVIYDVGKDLYSEYVRALLSFSAARLSVGGREVRVYSLDAPVFHPVQDFPEPPEGSVVFTALTDVVSVERPATGMLSYADTLVRCLYRSAACQLTLVLVTRDSVLLQDKFEAAKLASTVKKGKGAVSVSSSAFVEVLNRGERLQDLVLDPAVRDYLEVSVLAPAKARVGGVSAMLLGPMGAGKTAIAAAVANELNYKLVELNITAALSKWVGESEKNIRVAFKQLEDMAPAVILFRNLELMISRGRSDDQGVESRLRSMITSAVRKGFEGSLVMITSSYASKLPQEFLLDTSIGKYRIPVLPPLSPELRAEILRRSLAKYASAYSVKLEVGKSEVASVAEETNLFTPRELDSLAMIAASFAAKTGAITPRELHIAMDYVAVNRFVRADEILKLINKMKRIGVPRRLAEYFAEYEKEIERIKPHAYREMSERAKLRA